MTSPQDQPEPPESNPPESNPPESGPPESALPLAPGNPGVWIAAADLQFSFSRSGGPGGQNVNKVNTRAQLRISIDRIQGLDESALERLRKLAGSRLTKNNEIILESEAKRTQPANRRECEKKLQDLVSRAATPPKPRKPTRPTRGSKERRLESKRRQSRTKQRRQSPPSED